MINYAVQEMIAGRRAKKASNQLDEEDKNEEQQAARTPDG